MIDALKMSFRTLNLRKDPECPACGTHEITELIDYEEFCGVRQAAASDAAAQSAVPEITPVQLAARIARGDDFDLIDVREPHEWDIARIPGARLIPLATIVERAADARQRARHRRALQNGWSQREGRAAAPGVRLPQGVESRRRDHALERRCRSIHSEILGVDMYTAELPARGAFAALAIRSRFAAALQGVRRGVRGGPEAICGSCLGPLEPMYPATRGFRRVRRSRSRAPSMWRYREWLPFEGTPSLSQDTGFTPLVDAPRLADKLGVARLWIKNDAVSHPSLSFKDRVVASAINAASALGLDTVGCASTGNLANAVAAQAARAGLPAWIFIPDNLEQAKVLGTAVYGPHLVRVRGHYDDVNRLCAQLADRFGWGIVNVNLRGYYGEGSKTMGFEIAEQLGWRLPTAVVVPMAGGSLLTKLHKAFGEIRDAGLVSDEAPRLYGAQASGCSPITTLVESGGETIVPQVPNTIAKSIAIGNPADGVFAARAMRGHWRLVRGRERRQHRRRDPAAGGDDGDFHGDGGRRDARGRAGVGRAGKIREG